MWATEVSGDRVSEVQRLPGIYRLRTRRIPLPDIDWVEIPAGPFRFQGEQTIELPRYFLSRYPVTNAQYQSFIDAGGYQDDRWWSDLKKPELVASCWPQANRPRTDVDWYEATAFCRWLSAQWGVEIRLPTEVEWERAAAGAESRKYPWGDEYRPGLANVNETTNKDGLWNLGETTAVGVYAHGASTDGILDQSGNVWEWCANMFDEMDKVEPDTSNEERGLRGGSWVGLPVHARASARHRNHPGKRHLFIGFRVLASAPVG